MSLRCPSLAGFPGDELSAADFCLYAACRTAPAAVQQRLAIALRSTPLKLAAAPCWKYHSESPAGSCHEESKQFRPGDSVSNGVRAIEQRLHGQFPHTPVDEGKIDRSFISRARLGSDAITIVIATIELGHSMGLSLVAEGVEEPEAWHPRRQLGCDFARGFLISRPLEPASGPVLVHPANQLLPASDTTTRHLRALDHLAGR